MKHFIEICDLDIQEIKFILEGSKYIKRSRKGFSSGKLDDNQPLKDKTVALLLKKPSTRTRFSFELGIRQMGGHCLSVSGDDLQLSNSEKMSDTARVLSEYVDMIILRTDNHYELLELRDYSNVPVINGLSDYSHPCQILSDIFTFEEIVGPIKGKKVVWLGDGNNVCSSYIQAAEKLDFNFVYCGPEIFNPKLGNSVSLSCEIENNPKKAVTGADILVTDTWLSMHHSKHERVKRSKLMRDYQIDESLIVQAKSNCLVFHCMPLYRDCEISQVVADRFFETFLKQAANRLHVQKSIMTWCLS